ncbi:Surface layer-associated protease [Candidatus Nitrosotalea sp. TS]|uniref:hypothetical protein n=1 Tax=Candidatus Nitrosotalea sp. TS TaxID=2341020 RepID=UPI00140CC44E|nr:hypothetical protein [Candidatus Nitrosotalea sp. TS]NHI03995.1 Surface layer-associated protease [Candidatus Nitrosotalea sp. TS]
MYTDTIIPDMYDSYQDFLRLEGNTLFPKYGFDFTTQTPITLGSGNEFLVYDKNHNGNPIYSAGTVGARVLDLYGVIAKSAKIDKKIGAINGTLLPPLDPHGNFFGVMYDYGGTWNCHGRFYYVSRKTAVRYIRKFYEIYHSRYCTRS